MDRFDTPRTAQNVALLVRVRFHFLLPLAPTPPDRASSTLKAYGA